MKDYSVLNGMIENQKSELRTAYDKGYNQGVKDFDLILATSKKEEEGYNRGLEDAWECCKRFLNTDDICYEMGYAYNWDDFLAQSPSEAIARLKEYDAKHFDVPDNCKIEVGDVVRDDMFDIVGVVIRIEDNHAYVLKKDGIGIWTLDAVVKTGTHFEEVSDMMKHLENTDA